MKNIKIQYLYNSGFSIETRNHQMIFDYWKGSLNISDKNTLVFSSHGHPDHFNPEILKWKNPSKYIKYIFSDDISAKNINDSIYFMLPDKEIQLDGVKIKTLGSTDLGVSFLVNVDGISIFHSGDLNWWYWWDDTPEEIRTMEQAFKKEIDKLREEKIDVAFFPVDPRLKHNYSIGGEYFIKEIKPEIFIPMHFGENYSAIKGFADKVKECSTKVIEITAKGQEIYI